MLIIYKLRTDVDVDVLIHMHIHMFITCPFFICNVITYKRIEAFVLLHRYNTPMGILDYQILLLPSSAPRSAALGPGKLLGLCRARLRAGGRRRAPRRRQRGGYLKDQMNPKIGAIYHVLT